MTANRINIAHSIVWFDIPVKHMDRAVEFYTAVLDCKIEFHNSANHLPIGVIFHEKDQDFGSGCLHQVDEEHLPLANGTLLYFSVEGRLEAAVEAAKNKGGKVQQDIYSLGQWGSRAIILDSEGNRIALHSYS